MLRTSAIVVMGALVLACGGGAAPTPSRAPAPPTQAGTAASPGAGGLPAGDVLCELLMPQDWQAADLHEAGVPKVNSDGPGTAYCTYAGASGASGGLEFDAFVDASEADAQATFEVMKEGAGTTEELALPGADQAVINPDVDSTYGVIIVRKGPFSFTITVPADKNSRDELMALAATVLTRASF